MEKGNKSFEKNYPFIPIGDASVRLGDYDDGDGYEFDIDIKLQGLFNSGKAWTTKNINISGYGIQELKLIAEMFRDISNFIEENV